MKFFSCILFVVLNAGCVISSNTATPVAAMPIVIEKAGIDDACGAVGVVTDNENDSIPVFSRPDESAGQALMVLSGARVLLCDDHNDWYGIIVLKKGVNCILNNGQSINKQRGYQGPCNHGWVLKSNIDYFAG